ncbi:hypothetical protein [Ignatzschineria sp. LJL83]
MSKVRKQQRVQLLIDSFLDYKFKGRIESIAPATNLSFLPTSPSNVTRNFTQITQGVSVKIVFEDNQLDFYRLSIGMPVVVRISTDMSQKIALYKII